VPVYVVARISPVVVAATVAAGGVPAKRGTLMSASQPINEEQKVVPLAAVTLTQQEWDALGKSGISRVPEEAGHRVRDDAGRARR
jgi:hypothetical protein